MLTINASFNLSAATSNSQDSISASMQLVPEGQNFLFNTQSIGTGNTQLEFGNISDPPGCVAIVNPQFQPDGQTPNTYNLEISLDNAQAQIVSVLKPGQFVLLQPNTSTLYAKAIGGAIDALVGAVDA